MHLVTINGLKFEFCREAVSMHIRSGYSWLFVVLVVLVAAVYSPDDGRDILHIPDKPTVFWGIIAFCYIVLNFAFLAVIGFVMPKLRILIVPLPIVSSVVVTALLFFANFLLKGLCATSPGLEAHKINYFIYFFAIEQVLQVLYATFVPPLVKRKFQQRIAPVEAEESVSDMAAKVVVGGQQFPLLDIYYISSVEHYLRVVCQHEEHFIRERLSDVLAQISDRDGIQIHRSHLIFRGGIAWAKRSSEKFLIKTHDGSEFSVARSRRSSVMKWLQDRSIEIA